MKVKLEFFGQLTDITAIQSLEIDNVSNTNSALEQLYIKFPALQSAKFIIALNNSIIHNNVELTTDSVLALMPPYSGG